MRSLRENGFSELQANVIYGNYTTLAVPMLNLVGALVVPLTTVLLPFISKRHTDTGQKMISERISFALEILSLLIFPIATIFAFRSKEILLILFEDSSAVMASSLLAMLSPSMILISFSSVLNTALEGMGETKFPLISLIVGAVAKIALSILLIGNKKLELLGIPLATGLSYLISGMLSVYFIKFVKKLDIKISKKAALPLFSSLLSIGITSIIKKTAFKENTIFYLAELVLFGAIYLILISALKIQTLIVGRKMAK